MPRDLLTGEQFIQLRRELASVNGHSGDDGPPGDDLPSGIEDITDPAKVTFKSYISVHVKLGSLCGKVGSSGHFGQFDLSMHLKDIVLP